MTPLVALEWIMTGMMALLLLACIIAFGVGVIHLKRWLERSR